MTPERKRMLRDERYYFKPILQILQDNGGKLQDATQFSRLLPQYTDFTEDEINYSEISKKGNKYRPYMFGRNFALINIRMAAFLLYTKNEPVKLTPKGLETDIANLDLDRDIYQITLPIWKEKIEARRSKHTEEQHISQSDESEDEEMSDANDNGDDYKSYILDKVKYLDPIKFEKFAWGLLMKMGFDMDHDKGIKASGDGGIDGFAYSLDAQSLKTTRVAIQCKRYTTGAVGSPEINNLRGAIDTHRADYGVLITTSYFSKDAIESSRLGSTPITLIDGEKLVDLMIQYLWRYGS